MLLWFLLQGPNLRYFVEKCFLTFFKLLLDNYQFDDGNPVTTLLLKSILATLVTDPLISRQGASVNDLREAFPIPMGPPGATVSRAAN